jgi:hypothetical protein
MGCSDGAVGDKFLYLIAGTHKSGNAAFIKYFSGGSEEGKGVCVHSEGRDLEK